MYQRDINFRTLHALTPDLQKFSYKHCYKTFRAYAKRVDGFESIPLSGELPHLLTTFRPSGLNLSSTELLPKLEGIVSSKFRSGGPRSGSAILRRTRAPPVDRPSKTKSQEMIEDEDDDSGSEPESHDTPLADDAFEVEDNMDVALSDVAMPSDMHEHLQLDESMIDPALMDVAENTAVEDLLSPHNMTLAGAAAESVAVAEAEPVVSEPIREGEAAAADAKTEETTGKKRKHQEDGEKKPKKRVKKEKANDPASAESSASTSSVAEASNASTVSSENAEIVNDQPAEELTEEEKQRHKEEKRKRKEEKRARKEAKRQLAAVLEQGNLIAASGDDVGSVSA